MKPKQLIPLVVVLAVLAGLVYLRQAQNKPATIEQQYTLQTLMPEGFDVASLTKIEMYAGAKPDEKVVLERAADSTKWTLASKYGAPVNQTEIDNYLKTLKNLKGEFRAEVTGDGLKDYSLEPEKGFHVLGYTAGAAEPSLHLINGKSPDLRKAFARTDGSSAVYVIDISLRREAGIYTVEMDDAPEATHWLDKTALVIEEEKIKAVKLEYPDKTIAVELQTKQVPAEEATAAEQAAPAEEAPAEGEAAEPAPVEPVEEKTWALTSGGPGSEFHPNAAANLARRLTRINATDVVDPAAKADWKLDPPQYRATVTVDGQDAPVVIEGGRPDGDTYAYLRVAGAERDLVYQVSGYDFEQIFQKGSEFFELPGVLVESASVNAIAYTIGDAKVSLVKDGAAWKIASPQTDLPAQQTSVDGLARALLAWKAGDYADSADGKGLDDAADSVTFSGPDATHTIALGGTAPGGGRYARLNGGAETLVMSKTDVDAIFKPYAKLFTANVFDVDEGAIEDVTVTKGEASFKLHRTGEDAWEITTGDVTEPADALKVSDVIFALVDLRADNLSFPEARAPGDIFGTVSMVLDDDTELGMTVERSADGAFSVTKPGSNAVFAVSATQISRIFAEPAEIKPAPAPEPVAEPVAESTAETPAPDPAPAADAPAETPPAAAAGEPQR